jgi:putative sigma-54 modulation protein
MDLSIRGNGVTITDDLRDYANERATRLDRLVTSVDSANLELRHIHTKTGPDTITAQVTLKSGPTVLRSEERDSDVKIAIDRALAKIEQQVRKVHSKRARRKGSAVETIRGADVLVAPDLAEIDIPDTDDDLTSSIVRTKRFPVKPMVIDEAIEQMELLGHDFFIFNNADEDAISLLYRRRDGGLGLIVPERG